MMKKPIRLPKVLFILPKVLFILIVLAVFPQTVLTANASDLTLKDAFISKHPLKGRPSGGYFTVMNMGERTRVLVSVSSVDTKSIEMHETIMEKGSMKMVKRDEMIVPAGGHLAFEQGGKHLMVFGLTTDKEHLTAVLTFKNGEKISVDFDIRGPRSKKKKASHH